MIRIEIKKGLDLPIAGAPQQLITETKVTNRVALLGIEYPGLKPQLEVGIDSLVRHGQVLWRAKHDPRIGFTAPVSGVVREINRGAKRAFVSLVIERDDAPPIDFSALIDKNLLTLDRLEIKRLLLESGQWPFLRTRPFGKIPNPDKSPAAIFVTAMDTNPLAPDMAVILAAKSEAFRQGLAAIASLTEGKVYLCKAPQSTIPLTELPNLEVVEFAGPHPAGNPGTHIHFLAPVSLQREVWYIGAQAVAAIGELLLTGRISSDRVVALTGPGVRQPRLIRTTVGASVEELLTGEVLAGQYRLIAGSVLNGHIAAGAQAYLGAFQHQITVLPEGNQRELLGWLKPGLDVFSAKPVTLARWLRRQPVTFTTALNGSERAIVPVGVYEQVVPLDILPTYLLRALAVADIEEAEQLGCLELEEEDLALCTFVCPSKIDHGANLRRVLELIEKESQ
jgi:Na+-transporting NADH:ubiquinone oxidoreductase subunit A